MSPMQKEQGGAGNARPQDRMAGVQSRRLSSSADRWAEPPPQCCPVTGGYMWVTSMGLTLPRVFPPWAEPSERLRLEAQTQCGPFQRESCKAGVLMVTVSMYACAQAASCSCCQAKGRGLVRL